MTWPDNILTGALLTYIARPCPAKFRPGGRDEEKARRPVARGAPPLSSEGMPLCLASKRAGDAPDAAKTAP